MIIHDPEPNYFECEYCLKRFNLKYHLTAHLQNVHGRTDIKIYKVESSSILDDYISEAEFNNSNAHDLTSNIGIAEIELRPDKEKEVLE
jgi:hypothetical protein